jgi:carboxypeptidase C (cathepsin A)
MRTVIALLVVAATPLSVPAQRSTPYGTSGFGEADGIVTTRHSVTVAGHTLAYTARAGHIPIRDNDTGEVHGNMFFTAYTLDGAANDGMRPLTFLWNGGPGSSSSLVHLVGFGPKRLDAEGRPQPNDGTWLHATDLVFIDPIGTGYSRPAKAEYGPEFYQNRGDAESVAEFIRVYVTRADAWDAPLFLAGESFGVTRAVRVAAILQRKGLPPSGLMLIGLVPPLAAIDGRTRAALGVPTFAAAAHYHGVLAGGTRGLTAVLEEAEQWALREYAPALARRNTLSSAERDAIRDRLGRFTGIAPERIDSTLVVRMDSFTWQLLGARSRVVGRYDSRVTAAAPPVRPPMYDPTKDPSLEDIVDDVGVIRYFRSELRFLSDLRYQGPFGGGYPPPESFRGDWMSVRWNRDDIGQLQGNPSDSIPELQRVMRSDPALKVWTACGYYDLVCSYAVIGHMADKLEPALARNVTVRAYAGGHAIYTDPGARLQMRDDVTAFIATAARRN